MNVRTHGARAVAIACMCACALALGACSSDDDADEARTSTSQPDLGSVETSWSGAGPTLVVLGDSLTVQSRDELHRVLDPHYRTKIGAFVGEGYGGGPISLSAGPDRKLMQETATEFARDDPTVVVIELGTNDAWNPKLTLAAAHAGVAAITGNFPNACIVAVEASEWSTADDYDRDEAKAINADVQAVADVVVPALGPDEVTKDTIHPKPVGRTALAEAIAGAAQSCPPS